MKKIQLVGVPLAKEHGQISDKVSFVVTYQPGARRNILTMKGAQVADSRFRRIRDIVVAAMSVDVALRGFERTGQG